MIRVSSRRSCRSATACCSPASAAEARGPGHVAAVAIRVRIRLFAIQRELAGAREVAIELNAGATVEDAWLAVVARHPVLAPGRASLRFARNGDYAEPSTPLEDGDEVAVIPPVSGGTHEAWA